MMNTYGPKTLRGAKKYRVHPIGRITKVDPYNSTLRYVESMVHCTACGIHDLNATYGKFLFNNQTMDRTDLTAP